MKINEQGNRIIIEKDEERLEISCVRPGIMRCRYGKEAFTHNESMIIDQNIFKAAEDNGVELSVEDGADAVRIKGSEVSAVILKDSLDITWMSPSDDQVLLKEGKKEFIQIPVMKYTTGDEVPIIDRVKTVDGERNFIKNLKEVEDHKAWQGRLYFNFRDGEHIHGLGQAEEGIYDYRGHVQYLYQHNMRIPMPMFVSDMGYGMLFDCTSLMTFSDTENGSYMFFDTIPYLDYYFICGTGQKKDRKTAMDEIIAGFRYLTGEAAMLPKWAYGYVQSKEQYYTADELLEVAEHYRKLGIPLDCVVQDWNTWEKDKWGNKILDNERYGNMKECSDRLHEMNVHTMVSVWPNMNSGTENYDEFMANGQLLNDLATYDAFDEKAREVYWKQAKEGLFDKGFDSFWCDSTEPFSGPDWGGEIKREPWKRYQIVGEEHKKYLPPEKANAFALAHAKGIFENQRKTTKEKRVLNLTRSGYASGQKYAAMLWSGDTCASWDTLKRQITEGLNMGLSGYPYWTLDIGGFFTVGKEWKNRGCGCNNDPTPKWFWQGVYDEGVGDKAYCELYVRWLQMGAFLPMFRSHGTDTPREIWNFGKEGEPFYDAIAKVIKLRYSLMPYIYSLAGAVRLDNDTIMRSLLFDFPEDKKAAAISQEFMFGRNLLICPVTKPMYYDAGGVTLDEDKTWECYLPEGSIWYDIWDNKKYDGGQSVTVSAPIDRIPVFARSGSIIPMRQGLQYAMEDNDEPMELHVYTGSDGEFVFYDDAGDGYAYEDGAYERVVLEWSDKERVLTVGERSGSFDGMKAARKLKIYVDGEHSQDIGYIDSRLEIRL
ncbi:MAG: DUF5110 domain-containing protein [Lachnospiraceae bacterium]|nr:DUF5110 domain-containing protein [Lachnospiraceae bacterium]